MHEIQIGFLALSVSTPPPNFTFTLRAPLIFSLFANSLPLHVHIHGDDNDDADPDPQQEKERASQALAAPVHQHEVATNVLTKQKRVMDLLNKTRKPLSVAELHNELGFPVDRGELWDMVGTWGRNRSRSRKGGRRGKGEAARHRACCLLPAAAARAHRPTSAVRQNDDEYDVTAANERCFRKRTKKNNKNNNAHARAHDACREVTETDV